MSEYQKSAGIFLLFLIIWFVLLVTIGDLNRPAWRDEVHFYNAIKLFGDSINIDNLKHYDEMSTPLPFILYALWGKTAGFDLSELRILSLIIALFSFIVFHRILYLNFKNLHLIFWGTVFLVIHPYIIGFSILIYTDITAIFFLLLTILGFIQKKTVLFTIGLCGAIMSRQYLVFIWGASLIYFSLELYTQNKKTSLKMLMGTIVSAIPYGLLVLLWKGTSPINAQKRFI